MSRILLGITLVVFIGVIGFAALSAQAPATPAAVVDTSANTTAASDSQTSTAGDTQTKPAPPNSYTIAEVAKHTGLASCWVAINGNVYDLTKWIDQHPGGPDKILSICGTEASAAFNGQHGGDARPASELKNFSLGPLAK